MSIVLRPNQSLVGTEQALALFVDVLEALDTPISLGVALRIKYRLFDDLVRLSLQPSNYVCPLRFAKDYQAVSGLRKAGFLKTTIDRRQAAIDTFWKAERSCAVTNQRFNYLMYEGGLRKLSEDDPWMASSLFKAKALIHRILGELPKSLDYRFGPGATSLVKGEITLPKKYSREIHVTPEIYSYWRDITGPRWASHVSNVEIVSGNAVTFVPKDGKTDRSIAIEPHLNVYAQLGIGSEIRRRLSPWVDLNRGQDLNRFLASQAHSWDLATIDFSSASDTISRGLVAFLLPEEWWRLLDRVRSHRFTLDGEEYVNEKFSSMGNGFTFELESLIFYALARASGGSRCFTSAYGDDVILPRESADAFVRLSEYCGFQVNRDKSFLTGLFFESCGQDYFSGVPVRPFFWKDLKPTTHFKMSNDIQKLAISLQCRKLQSVSDGYFLSFSKEVRQCQIPQGYGDVGFIREWDSASPGLKRALNGYDGFITKAMKFRPRKKSYITSQSAYLASLDMITETSQSPVRGAGVYEIRPLGTFGSWVGSGRVV